jgi:putative ABC transport system permease protein
MPDWKDEIRARLGNLKIEPAREAAIIEELSQDLEDQYNELLSGGVTSSEAARLALAALHEGELLMRRLLRVEQRVAMEPIVPGSTRRAGMIADVWQDLRYGMRMLAKRPGFTLIAVLTLAIGIGANTAIFSVVSALLLRPPAGITQPEGLVLVTWDQIGLGPSYPDYVDFRDRNTSLAGLATFGPTAIHLSEHDEPERLSGAYVSGNYFEVLGMRAAMGRVLLQHDDGPAGSDPVTVISASLWRRAFNSDPNVVGKTVRLNGYPFTITGVASPHFTGVETGRSTDIWMPISMAGVIDPTLTKASSNRTARGWLRAFGRLKPNFTLDQARTDLKSVARSLETTFPETNKGVGIDLIPSLGLGPSDRTDARKFAGMLTAVAGLILLLACANVANLLLARGQARSREIGIRLAIGASRRRLIRQLLTESLLLATLGGVAGIFLAIWLSQPLSNFVSFGRGHSPTLNLTPDRSVLGFALIVAVASGLLFGLIPALQAARTELTPVLKETARGSRRKGRMKINGLLVAGQIAVSLVVLVAAGLIVRTLQNAQAVQPGFKAEEVVTASLDVGKQGYSEERGREFYRQVIERAEALPGVRSASLAHSVPLAGTTWNTRVRAEDQPHDAAPVPVDYNVVTPRFFATLEIPFISGRDFSEADGPHAPGVVILNETLARRLFPGENPLGKRVVRFIAGKPTFYLELVGIVRDAKYRSLTEPPIPQMYLPSSQQYRSLMTLHVRTNGNSEEILAAVRREVKALDPNLPVFNSRVLVEQLRASLSPQRSAVVLIGVLGLLALVLASIGLYGVMSYTVSQEAREIGVRIALGAERKDVLKLVLKRGMTLALTGVGIGSIASLALTRLIESLLFEVSATDPLTFCGVALILTFTALVACSIPALRATRVDPLIALRTE